jgi:hypothetical protein
MGLKRVFAPVLGALLLVLTQPSLAEQEPFHISYRQQNLSSDGLTKSGMLLVTVVNVSGENAQDLVASVPGPNNVTYDSRAIQIGDLADGQQVEVLNEFHVPQQFANPDAIEHNVAWEVEYTDSAGERKSVRVTGERVPE